MISRRALLRGSILGLGGSVATAAYGDYGSRAIQIERHELCLPRWKADGLRVAFFSDIHANSVQELERCIHASSMVAGLEPDLLLFGGDALNIARPELLDNIRKGLEPTHRLKCPKFAVLGNHDYWCNMSDGITRALSDSGFMVLKNEVANLGLYRIAGYDDQIGGHTPASFQPTEEGTLALLHEPDSVDIVPRSISLQLSGHSHGGQICLPFCIPVHTPRGARRYRAGFYPDAHVPLYVSRGVGTIGPNWRLFCPPKLRC